MKASRTLPREQLRFAKHLRTGQTALESRLWHELRAKRLDGWKFKRQFPIENYVVDFVCLEARLIVEVDGPLHREPEQRKKDTERDTVLQAEGFRMLRFDENVALGRILEEIRRALNSYPSPGP